MAKKRGRKPAAERPGGRVEYLQVRMTLDFKAWLGRYAEHRNLTMSDTIVQALIRDAKAEGFGEAPPRR